MNRVAFKMKLKPGVAEEYKRRHDEIWPELIWLLRQAGLSDYTICLDVDTDTLFALQTQCDTNLSQTLPDHPIMRRWWSYMKDLMECQDDGRPLEWPLVEMFHMD